LKAVGSGRSKYGVRLSPVLLSLILSCTVSACLPVTFAQGGSPSFIDEYHVPTANSAPLAITVDLDGGIWFTESNATKLAMFYPSNRTFHEYVVPWIGDMWGIAADSSGNIWFTQYSGKGNVNPGGAIVQSGYVESYASTLHLRDSHQSQFPRQDLFP